MPYIAIKAYPKEEERKKKLVEQINRVLLETWGCPQQAISIFLEDVSPEDWEEKVVKPEIEPNKEKMMILQGRKLYEE